ncbi:unnamed protein product [Blepharisma stoltei]|uniref:Uncharacterized protein n=1 Tax=Blepharisma stoltei TaxID=1481888 RepID=A0AAU9JKW2_9CILI|nr:unnamed protein product [Blepharisma stoltei]
MSRLLAFLFLLFNISIFSAELLKENSISQFISGFANGVRASSTIDIPCITAYPALVTQFSTLENAISDYQDFSTLLHVFKSTVTGLVSFCQTCNFQNTISTIQAMLTTGEGLDTIFILIFTNLSFYQNALSIIQTSLENGLYYEAGTQAGVIYYNLFG